MGDGNPGIHNWSGTDNRTSEETPLGGIPEMVKWSVSVVRTPHGWVGRVDNHLKKTTVHVPVEPNIPAELAQKVSALLPVGTEDDWEDRDWYDDLDDDELDLEDPYGDDLDDEYDPDDDQIVSPQTFEVPADYRKTND